MRVSSKDPFVNVAVKEVWLNGVLQKLCVSADDQLGEIEIYQQVNGRLLTDFAGGDVKTKILKGKVEIVLHAEWEYVGGQLRLSNE
jgi:uncharacterized protein (DUF39 family)